MTKKMLIDAAHPEQVRVALQANGRIEDFDFETATRRPLRGNIYLARVTRVEPSLQAAFVDYGGNRHGFLAFSEIHPDYYQVPVSDRKALQDAEREVAELAEKLDLAQRGDEDDDDPADRADDDRGELGDEDAREEGSETARAHESASEEAPGDKSEDGSGDKSGDAPKRRRRSRAKKAARDDAPSPSTESAPRGDREDDDDEDEDEEEDVDAETLRRPLDDQDRGDDARAEQPREEEARDATQNDQEDDARAAHDDDGAEGGEERERAPASGKEPSREALMERYKEARRKRAGLLRNYKIQEVIKRRQIILIQVVKEERGTKGAALTTYLSLAGRYCVLMPNTARGGGISRKIANGSDRRRLRRVVDSLEVPHGIGLIIRTAGAKRTKTEIKRDYDYLLRLWENIRSLTLKSIAPCLVYEEASLIKRAIRDLYDKEISKVLVEGEAGYREAKDFMKMLMPSHAKNVQPYKETAPIFMKHGVESQLDGMYQPQVRLKSGGSIVIHQTEALVAIDVNSGRSTRERNIEQTALKTNLEAAEEASRQFRLRDLAGLIVIDFIDMEENRNNRKVEKALNEALKADRARVQVGRISTFGLLELSRQRRRSGIVDGTTQQCPTCKGAGVIRSNEVAALRILRAIEAEAVSGKVGLIQLRAGSDVCLHVLNHNREWLARIEGQHGVKVELTADSELVGDDYEMRKSGAPSERRDDRVIVRADDAAPLDADEPEGDDDAGGAAPRDDDEEKPSRRRRRRGGRGRSRDKEGAGNAGDSQEGVREEEVAADTESDRDGASADSAETSAGGDDNEGAKRKRRRRGRRGGRRNRKDQNGEASNEARAEPGGEDDKPAAGGAKAEMAQASETQGEVPDEPPKRDAPAPAQTTKDAGAEGAVDEGAPVVDLADVEPVGADAESEETGPRANGAGSGDDAPSIMAAAPRADSASDDEGKADEDLGDDDAGEKGAGEEDARDGASKKKRRGWWQRAIGG